MANSSHSRAHAESAENPVAASGTSSAAHERDLASVTSPIASTNARVQAMLAERRQRLETDKVAKEVAEQEKRKAAAAARREAETHAGPSSSEGDQAKYARMQRERETAARTERERVLRTIENDKIERRERAQRAKKAAEAQKGGNYSELKQDPKATSSKVGGPGECALKVRMFDGNTISFRFSSSDTIETVRSWIEQESEGDVPYTLKLILAPLPNREITITEEKESLGALGMTPTAILVKVPVPVQGATQKQEVAPGGLARMVGALRNLFALIGFVLQMFNAILGTTLRHGEESDATTEAPSEGGARATGSQNVRTLQQRKRPKDEQQLYNGNQVFQTRRTSDCG